jgi:hypothetical protein
MSDESKECPKFHRGNVDFLKHAPTYQKRAITHAQRMTGPFEVATAEGSMRCEDGYLALDARGYPYCIAKDEFELIYVPWVSKNPASEGV